MEGNQNGSIEYRVDLVLCIDGTLSMKDIIDHIKNVAMNFYAMVLDAMGNANKAIKGDEFRVRCVVFRDYKVDGENAMEESRFFSIIQDSEQQAFNEYVSGITASGGGDAPENALEAIFTAMKSDWNPRGGRYRRQIIVLFTDAPYLPLHAPDRVTAPNYPLDAPKSFEDLQYLYEEGDQMMAYTPKNGRLILYVPEGDMDWYRCRTWNRTWVVPIKPKGGCSEVDLNDALAIVVGSF